MLTKQQIKTCLAGEDTPLVPCHYHWYDGKFCNAHEEELREFHKLFEDDFIKAHSHLVTRAPAKELEEGEFMDNWGCLFAAAPDGVGSHPTRPVVNSLSEWEAYVDSSIPDLGREDFDKFLCETVQKNPDRYVMATFWRTFYERMYMIIGFERLMVEIADGSELFLSMLKELKDFTVRGIE